MISNLEVLFTPADFAALKRRNLDDAVCVVFDVFRATSSMVAALANGAASIIAVAEISEALEAWRARPGVLLAGERDGVRIRRELTGGVDFDLGNSPREFTREKVGGKTIVMTTTNGTRALRACAHARTVLIGSFLNLNATAERIRRQAPAELLIVCSGTFDQAAYEDALGAGALCQALERECAGGAVSDAALICRLLYEFAQRDLAGTAAASRNARRLLSIAELRDDVPFCLRLNALDFAAGLGADGSVSLL